MMRTFTSLAIVFMLSGCFGPFTSFASFASFGHNRNLPQADRIIVDKSDRRMWLLKEGEIIRSYHVDLGFAPVGDKKVEGDGRTPEGVYRIDRRNPRSRFHLSLGISYPNRRDIAEARAMGKDPGGDIFIHGGPRLWKDRNRRDWTDGCIAVTDWQMSEIYAMVSLDTPIYIRP